MTTCLPPNPSLENLFDALDFERLDRIPGVLARAPIAALNRPFAECLSR